ncbi:hypothetical protein KR038_006487 [Drosophila bunnanda]|nr:hypothetical protein KR038_006487 [Drosophila bunnanda]
MSFVGEAAGTAPKAQEEPQSEPQEAPSCSGSSKLHPIPDEELATAGSLKSPSSGALAKQVMELQLRLGIRPHKAYKFQLLNQLARLMDAQPDPKVIFPQTPLEFDATYWESEAVGRLAPEERDRRRFDAFYDYLDNEFVRGDRGKAFKVVVDALVRLTERRLQATQGPGDAASGDISPRSFDLIPPQQWKRINSLLLAKSKDQEGSRTRT